MPSEAEYSDHPAISTWSRVVAPSSDLEITTDDSPCEASLQRSQANRASDVTGFVFSDFSSGPQNRRSMMTQDVGTTSTTENPILRSVCHNCLLE